MSNEEDPYRRPEPAPRGPLQLGEEPLQFATTPTQRNAGPVGLGGWLILVGFGVCMTPLRLSAEVAQVFGPVLRDGGWRMLFDGERELMLRLLVWFELIANAILIVGSVVMICLFFMRSHWFPRVFIGFIAASFAVLVLDIVLAGQVTSLDGGFQAEDARGLTRALIYAGVWVPYMLVSKRVRNTFVAPDRRGRSSYR